MNKSKTSKSLVQTACSIAVGIAALGGPASPLCQAEPPATTPPPQTGSAPAPTNSVAAAKPAGTKKSITGAELYSMNCNRCHQERYPTERTAAQWRTIMLHMQVRANLPVRQAKLILQYLQDNSGR